MALRARFTESEFTVFRWLSGVSAALFVGLVITGVLLALTRRADPGWTRAVAENSTLPPVPRPTPVQDLHTMLGDVLGLVMLVSIAWLMMVVIAGWSWPLVGAGAMVGVAAVSGGWARFMTVVVDGVVGRDAPGFGFVLDPGFDEAVLAGRRLGSTMFRLWFSIHLVAPVVAVAFVAVALKRFGGAPQGEPHRPSWLDRLAESRPDELG